MNNRSNRAGKDKGVIPAPRVIVKFQDSLQLPYEDGIERYLEESGVSDWYKLKEKFPKITFKRLFDEQPSAKILELVGRATELDKTYKPPNFLTYFVIDCKEGILPHEIVKFLSEWEIVETAYVQSPPLRPAMPGDDPRYPMQGYLTAAATGIDAVYAWDFGEGAEVRFVDIEGDWQLNHEDLRAAGITLLSGMLSGLASDRSHGTAVLGEVRAVDNTLGCIGIAPRATVNVISDTRATGFSHAQAVVDAAARLNFGDVALLEIQERDFLLPIEVQQAEFDAIRLATALGIVIIEPSGNGDNDLDIYSHPVRGRFLNRTDPAFRDSGAIMVGRTTSRAPHRRLTCSHGNRVDCYAWGENITTLSADGLGSTNLYTDGFGGTSGASPIIAGAAVLLQGIAQTRMPRELQYRFSPKQMRVILSDPANGTPSGMPAVDRVGVMPNLHTIIDRVMNIAPDVYVRDYPGDIGDHTFGEPSTSPDIIVRDTEVTLPLTPQGVYGHGSMNENRDDLSMDPISTATDYFIYVRAMNRGGEDATNVRANVYWAESATLVTPGLWTEIGSTVIPNVEVGNRLTVSPEPIRWNRALIPPPGHYCFVCLIGNDRDPAPERADFVNWDNYVRFIVTNNNVAWRNFNTNTRPSRPTARGMAHFLIPFLLTGAEDREEVFDIEILPMLPKGAEVRVQMPEYLVDVLTGGTPYKKINPRDNTASLPVPPFGKHRFSKVLLPAQLRARCALEISIPEEWLKKNNYCIAIRQLYQAVEVGRISWTLTGEDKKTSPQTKANKGHRR